MAITLIQEDGSEVADANTLATLAEYEVYIADRGLTDARTDEAKKAALIESMDWVNAKEHRMGGSRVSSTQTLPFPRYGLWINNFLFSSSSVPGAAKNAQMQLAHESISSALFSVGNGQTLTAEEYDVIKFQYANTGNSSPQNVFTKVDALLGPLYANGGSLFPGIRV